ncbi:hypothetical protein NE237_017878 [Protea cynaroides]|uniref:Uncharacterized protein n=1 Tax=Protea cynaroides TaxID=273540 RepID=A0A9Q0QNM5_9MAGN|nr:hypothetical protein NE237_017878 [Protea cynaroides]
MIRSRWPSSSNGLFFLQHVLSTHSITHSNVAAVQVALLWSGIVSYATFSPLTRLTAPQSNVATANESFLGTLFILQRSLEREKNKLGTRKGREGGKVWFSFKGDSDTKVATSADFWNYLSSNHP